MDSTQYAAEVAGNVDRAMQAQNVSVLRLASLTGIPRTTLDRRLRSAGGSPFSVAEVKAIANALDCTAASLTTVYEADARVTA